MNGKTVDIKNLSEFVILYFAKNGIPINHLKLQKILYYIQAWHMVYFDGNPLFEDVPEAWVNGPVYRSIYEKFKMLGSCDNLNINGDYSIDVDNHFEEIKNKMNLEEEQYDFLNDIFNHYALMPHEKLILLTHIEKPWNQAREGMGPFEYSDNKISHKSMCEYYKQRLEKSKQLEK